MEEIMVTKITAYLVLMSLIGFTSMGVDKRRAIKKAWRISERTLLIIAFIGGGIGSFLGMYSFRHKTKHTKFVVLLPLAAVLYLALILKLYNVF